MLTSLDSKNKIISDEVNSNKRENSGSKIPYLKRRKPRKQKIFADWNEGASNFNLYKYWFIDLEYYVEKHNKLVGINNFFIEPLFIS